MDKVRDGLRQDEKVIEEANDILEKKQEMVSLYIK